MDKLKTANHPILILVRGIPGSGKSYVANKFKDMIGDDKVVLVDPDAIDLSGKEYSDFSNALTAEDVDAKFHPYRFLRAKAHQAILDDKILVWNQGFTNLDGFQKTVDNLQTHASENNKKLPTLVVEVEVDSDIAKARVAKRASDGGHDVPEEAFARFINDYVSFADQGYNTVTLNGEDDVEKSVESILKALENLLAKD